MANKIISVKKAASMVKDGMTIMTGGFVYSGYPRRLIDELIETGVKNLTLICNDNGSPTTGVGKMVLLHRFKKIIASHVGRSPETGRQMIEGEVEVELVPQGTLAERIRCGGAGIGGFYTPTGVGTEVEEGKEKRIFDGKEYLLEMPLRADVALIKASVADKKGNLIMKKTSINFNPLMAMAADLVIAEADKIVEVGELDPNCITVPSIFVDYIVGGDSNDR